MQLGLLPYCTELKDTSAIRDNTNAMERKGQSCLLTDQVAIVTGASSGIGRAVALAFIRQGAIVVCSDLVAAPGDDQPTHELIAKEGGRGMFVKTDVSSEESMQHLVSATVKEYGRLDM